MYLRHLTGLALEKPVRTRSGLPSGKERISEFFESWAARGTSFVGGGEIKVL
jgi:hypothetical protein